MQSFKSVDPQNMFQSIYDFPDHILRAIEIGKMMNFNHSYNGIKNIVIAGMGGSAIGGDVAKVLTNKELEVPLFISRNYKLPNWVNKNTLVICSSYSGNTEETIASFDDAKNKGASIIGISTGGNLTKKLNKYGLDSISIPNNLQPRAALGFSLVPILFILNKLDFIGSDVLDDINAGVILLKKLRDKYSNENNNNLSYSIAKNIYNTIPIIYAENNNCEVIAVRWKGQLSENSKMLAYHNELPEMNHNEIVGWENNNDLIKNCSVIWLSDKSDYPRTVIRMKASRDIIGHLAKHHEIISVDGDSRTVRLLHLIHLGDWISFWCAVLHGTNPNPVEKIDKLKTILSKKS